jgi:ABC-type glycerol-3-phosphate transport system permease component
LNSREICGTSPERAFGAGVDKSIPKPSCGSSARRENEQELSAATTLKEMNDMSNIADTNPSSSLKSFMNRLMDRSDSVVAMAGLFANIGLFSSTLSGYFGSMGTFLYIVVLVLGIFVAYGLWTFKFWGWAITVLFSLACIVLVLPSILNYHAALVSMILLSYIVQPSVRDQYKF